MEIKNTNSTTTNKINTVANTGTKNKTSEAKEQVLNEKQMLLYDMFKVLFSVYREPEICLKKSCDLFNTLKNID